MIESSLYMIHMILVIPAYRHVSHLAQFHAIHTKCDNQYHHVTGPTCKGK